jgi:pSer/pThr/pTyr-binding forkhead associated (FHA) protein
MNQPSQPVRETTQMETDQEILEALRAEASGRSSELLLTPPTPAKSTIPMAPPAAPAPPKAQATEVALFRPTIRPPLAVLTVIDDGKTEGETFRLRGDAFTIGRTEGDLRIPFDELMSTRHVQISLRSKDGVRQWVVTDLKSTNGLFFRVSRANLADGTQFLVGKGRYRIEMPAEPPAPAGEFQGSATRAWDAEPIRFPHPILVEMVSHGMGMRLPLTKQEYWIGTDSSCEIHRADDPFADARHLRIYRSDKGWHLQNNKSLNGLWLRMTEMAVGTDSPVGNACLFQIGEQRFRLTVGG